MVIPAVVISVEPQRSFDDAVISDGVVKRALESLSTNQKDPAALIVRTLPNDESKASRAYSEEDMPAYFTTDAVEFIVAKGIRHLLVDLPSIDRLFDAGKLLNHRIFWDVEPGRFEINERTRVNSTITELIYVPNEVPDGEYLLNLQIAPFESDAAPSRPILMHVQERA